MKPATPAESRDICMARMGFDPIIYNMAVRGAGVRHSKERRALWWWMRNTPLVTGGVPSYPQIAEATGVASHSTVIKGVKLMDKEMAAAISSGIVPVVERPLPMNRKGAAKMKGTR